MGDMGEFIIGLMIAVFVGGTIGAIEGCEKRVPGKESTFVQHNKQYQNNIKVTNTMEDCFNAGGSQYIAVGHDDSGNCVFVRKEIGK